MNEVKFDLTVRVKDIEEICFNSETYLEIKNELNNNYKYFFFYSAAATVSLILIMVNYEVYIVFIFALLGFLFNLLKININKRKIKIHNTTTSEWINTFIHFKSHAIFVNEKGIRYIRDNEETDYKYNDFDLEQSWIHPDLGYVKIKTNQDESLLLPAKSFDNNEYNKFLSILKELDVLQ